MLRASVLARYHATGARMKYESCPALLRAGRMEVVAASVTTLSTACGLCRQPTLLPRSPATPFANHFAWVSRATSPEAKAVACRSGRPEQRTNIRGNVARARCAGRVVRAGPRASANSTCPDQTIPRWRASPRLGTAWEWSGQAWLTSKAFFTRLQRAHVCARLVCSSHACRVILEHSLLPGVVSNIIVMY
jgi:hypothetical protein